MPKIPEYVSQVQVVGAPGGRNASPADFGAATATGLDDAGNTFARVAASAQEFEAQREVSDLHAQLSDLHAATAEDLRTSLQNADPGDKSVAERVGQRFNDNLAKIEGNITTPAGRNFATRAGASMRAHYVEQAMAGQAALAGEKAKADVSQAYNKYSSALMNDPSSFDFTLAMNNEGIDNLVQSGRLPAGKGIELKQALSAGLAESAVRGWIALNPDDAKNQLNSGKWDSYINGDLKKQLLGESDQAIRAKRVEEHLQKEQAKEALKAQHMETQNNFLAKFASGQLTTKEVLASNLDPFGSGSKEQFIQMLKAQANQGQGMKTDPGTMIQLFNDIQSGKIRDENDLNQYFGKGLTIESLNQLRGEIQGRRTTDGKIESKLKDGLIDVAKASLTKSNPLLGIKDPEGEERLQSWLTWFLPEYDKQRKAGKSPADLLTPESPDYLGKTLKQYIRKPADIIRAQSNSFGASTTGTPPPPPGFKAPN